jgi:hypothetical protein
MLGVLEAQPDCALPVKRACSAEDALLPPVVARRLEAEVVAADPAAPVVVEAGQRPGLLAHVAFRIAASGAEGEQLHQLARVVFVRRPFRVLRPREPQQHRRVFRDLAQHRVERAERQAAQQLVLVQHQLLRADAVERGGEPVVPDERHPLHEWAGAAHHPVEPPELVVAPRVAGSECAAFVVARLRADELLAGGPGE